MAALIQELDLKMEKAVNLFKKFLYLNHSTFALEKPI